MGIDTSNPDLNNSGDDLVVADSGPARLALINTASAGNDAWTFDSNDTLRVLAGTDASKFTLDDAGNLTILGNLVTGGGGTSDPEPCDAVFDPEVYSVPSIEEHAALMWQNKHLLAVDPTTPDAPFNVTEKLARVLNELEHAHICIEQLNAELKQQRAQIDELKELTVAQ